MGLVGKGRRLLEVLQQGVLKHVLRLRALVEVGAGQPQHRVPVRRLAEYLGYTVEWHPEDGTVTLDSGSMHATLTLGVNSYQAVTSLEGMVGMTAPFALAAAPYAVDGVTYAPLELFVVLMGNPEEAVTAADGGVELTTQQPADGVQLPNPWQACASLAELEQAAGYPVPLPALPEGLSLIHI